MKIQTSLNRLPHKGEVNRLPSVAVPNDSYTIRELLDKFTTGIMPNVFKEGTYSDDDLESYSQIDNRDFDMVDAFNMSSEMENNRDRYNAAKKGYIDYENKVKEENARKATNLEDDQKNDKVTKPAASTIVVDKGVYD